MFDHISGQQRVEETVAARLHKWVMTQYWLGLVPGLLILIYRDFIPQYIANDAVRLVSSRLLYDPSFLSHDWLLLAHYDEDRLTILFRAFFAPLWFLTKNGIVIAIVARAFVWTFVSFAIVRLAKAMELPRFALAVGFFYWVDQGQSLGAGEWIFGDAEGKCLAYGCLFLAVAAFLTERPRWSAAICGVAFWFHVPVALWTVLAFYTALLVTERRNVLKGFVIPGLITVAVSLPMALMALKYMEVSAPAPVGTSIDWLIVMFRNPHHMDPHYFGGWREIIELVICATLAMLSFRPSLEDKKRMFLSFLLLALIGEFACGLFAREANLLGLLKVYPFRAADVLVFFFACVTLPALIADLISRSSIVRFSRLRTPGIRVASAMIACALLMIPTTSLGLMKSDKFFVHRFVTSWSDFAHHQQAPYDEMTQWISVNVPKYAVIIAPPWLNDFSLESERATVVNFGRDPHNGLIVEWYRRYRAMNGEDFHTVGLGTMTELQKNYPQLSAAQLGEIKKDFGGDYYFTTQKREDLVAQLVHADGSYYLYRVQ
jgi:hypothetical protein